VWLLTPNPALLSQRQPALLTLPLTPSSRSFPPSDAPLARPCPRCAGAMPRAGAANAAALTQTTTPRRTPAPHTDKPTDPRRGQGSVSSGSNSTSSGKSRRSNRSHGGKRVRPDRRDKPDRPVSRREQITATTTTTITSTISSPVCDPPAHYSDGAHGLADVTQIASGAGRATLRRLFVSTPGDGVRIRLRATIRPPARRPPTRGGSAAAVVAEPASLAARAAPLPAASPRPHLEKSGEKFPGWAGARLPEGSGNLSVRSCGALPPRSLLVLQVGGRRLPLSSAAVNYRRRCVVAAAARFRARTCVVAESTDPHWPQRCVCVYVCVRGCVMCGCVCVGVCVCHTCVCVWRERER
jgi:hypothetical protein